jgi:excisionase family DNA binding protein
LEDDRADTLEDLRRLCDHGVRIALDDFGTGYASLERLKRLPFDELKLDQSFVAGLPSNRRDASLVEAMVRMGRSLGLTVVAEGVETAEQVGFMRRLACDQAQGFHFSRPVSAPAALALLRRRRRWNVAVGGQGPGRPPAEEDELLTLSQAATALGVSTTTTRRWANSGELASTRTSGGHRRFPASEVRRLRSRRHRPSVRVGEPPREPLPALAKVAETLGPRLTQAAWRELYDDTPGFFGDPDAEEAHVRWLDAIASAAQTGNYAMLREATETFMEEARRRGAPLLERHAALERFAAVAARALGRAGAPHTDVVAARRLFAFLQQRHLAASE